MESRLSKIYHQEWILVAFLLGFCSILYFINLDQWDLWGPDEPRYAEVSREMVMGGDWILMHYNGEVYADKPPLFFWAIALSSYLWRGFTAFSVRFPSAFFGTLTVLLTFILGKNLFSIQTGFFSGLILATSLEFAILSTRASIDATLTFFITTSILCFIQWFQWRKEKNKLIERLIRYGFYMGMAFATLTKGPVGFILPLLVGLIYLSTRKDWSGIKELKLLPGMLFCTAIVLCWYLPAVIKGGEKYLHETLFIHTIDRFAKGIAHVQPIYYYFLKFPMNYLPWIVFLPFAIAYGISNKNRNQRKEFFLIFLWFIVVFTFFSLSKGKRPIYILPLYPAASLMIGKFLDDSISVSMIQDESKWFLFPFFGLGGLAFLSGGALPWAISNLFPSYWPYAIPVAFLLMGGSIALFFVIRMKRYTLAFFIIIGIFAGGFFYTFRIVFPIANSFKSARFISQRVISEIQHGEKIATYRFESGPFNFYTQIVPILELVEEKELFHFLNSTERVFCLIRLNDLEMIKMKNKFPIVTLAIQNQETRNSIVLISNRSSSIESLQEEK